MLSTIASAHSSTGPRVDSSQRTGCKSDFDSSLDLAVSLFHFSGQDSRPWIPIVAVNIKWTEIQDNSNTPHQGELFQGSYSFVSRWSFATRGWLFVSPSKERFPTAWRWGGRKLVAPTARWLPGPIQGLLDGTGLPKGLYCVFQEGSYLHRHAMEQLSWKLASRRTTVFILVEVKYQGYVKSCDTSE